MESKYNVGDKVRLLIECDDLDSGDIITLFNQTGEIYWECEDTNGHLFVFNENAFEPIKDELVVDNKKNNLDKGGYTNDKFLSKFDEQNANEYYGGKDNPYEAIKIINNLDLNFNRGNVLKYILRAGKKDADKEIQDLQKAKNYIDYEIERLKIMNNK